MTYDFYVFFSFVFMVFAFAKRCLSCDETNNGIHLSFLILYLISEPRRGSALVSMNYGTSEADRCISIQK